MLSLENVYGEEKMKKKVAIAGNILLDVVKRIDAWPEEGMLVNISEEKRSVGGCVCNTGIDLKALSTEVAVTAYGKVGMDEYGEWVLGQMQERGIDVSHVAKSVSCPTSYTDVMTVKSTGQRTFFHARGSNAEFSPRDVDVENLDCDLFHLGYLLLLDEMDAPDPLFGTKAARLLHDVQKKGIKTCIDLVSDQSGKFNTVVPPALRYCNYVVINEVEGEMLTGTKARDFGGVPDCEHFKEICRKIMQMGVKDAVVIHSPELSCSLEANGHFTIIPSLDIPWEDIVGTVGAGDAFCAGMLYAFITDMNMADGMRLASCVAACNLAAADSVSNAKTLEEALCLEKKYQRRPVL